MGTLARRIIGELQSAWGEDVDESKLPDDDQIACAQAKQLIMRGPPHLTPTSSSKDNNNSSNNNNNNWLSKDTTETTENDASAFVEVI